MAIGGTGPHYIACRVKFQAPVIPIIGRLRPIVIRTRTDKKIEYDWNETRERKNWDRTNDRMSFKRLVVVGLAIRRFEDLFDLLTAQPLVLWREVPAKDTKDGN